MILSKSSQNHRPRRATQVDTMGVCCGCTYLKRSRLSMSMRSSKSNHPASASGILTALPWVHFPEYLIHSPQVSEAFHYSLALDIYLTLCFHDSLDFTGFRIFICPAWLFPRRHFCLQIPSHPDPWDISKKIHSNKEQQWCWLNGKVLLELGQKNSQCDGVQGWELCPLGKRGINQIQSKRQGSKCSTCRLWLVNCRLGLSEVSQSSFSRRRLRAWTEVPQIADLG